MTKARDVADLGGGVSTADITDAAVNEAKLQVSNAPTNGYTLTAQSAATGGMTWAEAGGGAWEVVSSGVTASAVAQLDFTSMDLVNYDYKVLLRNFRPSGTSFLKYYLSVNNFANNSYLTSTLRCLIQQYPGIYTINNSIIQPYSWVTETGTDDKPVVYPEVIPQLNGVAYFTINIKQTLGYVSSGTDYYTTFIDSEGWFSGASESSSMYTQRYSKVFVGSDGRSSTSSQQTAPCNAIRLHFTGSNNIQADSKYTVLRRALA
tara:strand:+ start:715 stop:1500 length:786 start_codon:yes stop_codon:yes gene_type:complete